MGASSAPRLSRSCGFELAAAAKRVLKLRALSDGGGGGGSSSSAPYVFSSPVVKTVSASVFKQYIAVISGKGVWG